LGSGSPLVIAGPISPAGIDVSLASDSHMQRHAPLLKNRSVVLFDWRGPGASGPAPGGFSLDGFVRDLASVVDERDADLSIWSVRPRWLTLPSSTHRHP